jgi:hypothetical protein
MAGRSEGVPKGRAKRSRRELIAGAAGALGVLTAETVLKPTPALAGTDGDVVLGNNFSSANNTSQPTTIGYSGSSFGFVTTITSVAAATAVTGEAGAGVGVLGTSDSSDGVLGTTGGVFSSSGGNGVHGKVLDPTSSSGIAVFGEHAGGGVGVKGTSSSGDAVLGTTAGTANAIHGQNTNSGAQGTGVFGEHTGGGTGVFGQANSIGHSGVVGNNLGTGPGVSGTGGVGVAGVTFNSTGAGVSGVTNASGGTGVAAFTNVSGGVALGVSGPAKFSLSGLVTIAAGATSATVTGVSLRTGSLVLATVQNNAGVLVQFATPKPSQSLIIITLNKVVPSGKTATVAWFVVN